MVEQGFPPVTLIIPNYNGAHLLRRNLPFVMAAAAAYPGACPIVVVDDGSGDGSAEMLRGEFPSIRVVAHKANRGFAEAIRSGVDAAESEFLIFLNSDVRPREDFIAPLIRHLARADVFSVSPLVLDEDGRVNPVSWRCFRIRRGRLRSVRWRFDDLNPEVPTESLFASGGSVALRKSMFEALGGFLPLYKPFYSEDFDLGLRAWKRGWRTLLEPASRVMHERKGSISENVAARRVGKTRVRNRFLLEWTHMPGRDLALYLMPGYLLQLIGRLARLDLLYVEGFLAALRRLPEALRVRAEIRRHQVLDFWRIVDSVEQSFKSRI
ncbi:glycosyltransferase family 2 protein [Methylocaldum szegediense]|uniref:GT2 family glycosyltransferase n=1 Tax=Methylocaldum szegediense TaxID=73780 RepID=A0ABM9I7L4_9GAMM|nr:glycosyltransferase family 2 protein [Methylocaldum szegediense]CAI8944530.1 GT2 family glycosyltransferase [Methylocaldum szegediense]